MKNNDASPFFLLVRFSFFLAGTYDICKLRISRKLRKSKLFNIIVDKTTRAFKTLYIVLDKISKKLKTFYVRIHKIQCIINKYFFGISFISKIEANSFKQENNWKLWPFNVWVPFFFLVGFIGYCLPDDIYKIGSISTMIALIISIVTMLIYIYNLKKFIKTICINADGLFCF